MQDISEAFALALSLILAGDADLLEIVWLSLRVTFTAVAIAAMIGFPAGAALALARFPGKSLVTLIINTAMGLPPVVVGLTLYLLLSRVGPFGVLELLYTPSAMIIAQCVLVTPIIIALTRTAVSDLAKEHDETLRAMRAGATDRMLTLLREAHPQLLTALFAGLGRAFAEVGAVMIVGGNINHVTRVMTTSIALETSRGELAFALALGIVLMLIALVVNALASLMHPRETELIHAR